ncbi:cytochrome c [Fimbriiglobus ruber]|uniref:cytochrome c n=1 Tax=Fimbriiglobus ruber TaxID=1908690 RepID=UPI00117B04DB|nr:c-type cytochrome [Fimbriiglobus ruber]
MNDGLWTESTADGQESAARPWDVRGASGREMGRVRGRSWSGVGSRVAGGCLALSFSVAALIAFLSGCSRDGDAGGGYDPSWRYPLRADPIVVRAPVAQPPDRAPAGKLDEVIATFPSLGGKLIDTKTLPDDRKQALTAALDELFGTPAAPTVSSAVGGSTDIPGTDLSPGFLAVGSRVYRRLCNQCHGMTGDGRGPSGQWIYPCPRDVRQGVFKIATAGPKPRIDALVRLLRQGVPGTPMPVFDLIPDEDVRAVTAYVVHLSLRGEVEFRVTRAMLDETGEADVSDVAAECRGTLAKLLTQWAAAQSAPPPPEVPADPVDAKDAGYQESVRRGHALFTDEKLGCVKCHQDYGRKDVYLYDVWGGTARAADLTRGEFRWGRDPTTLAARVRHGIPASGMPAAPADLTAEQVIDLVRFVGAAGFPQRLPENVRSQVKN